MSTAGYPKPMRMLDGVPVAWHFRLWPTRKWLVCTALPDAFAPITEYGLRVTDWRPLPGKRSTSASGDAA